MTRANKAFPKERCVNATVNSQPMYHIGPTILALLAAWLSHLSLSIFSAPFASGSVLLRYHQELMESPVTRDALHPRIGEARREPVYRLAGMPVVAAAFFAV